MIAFTGARIKQRQQIYTMADNGTGLRCLTEGFSSRETIFFDPIWSPDGKSLAFTLKEHVLSPYTRVCTITVDNAEVQYLTPREGNNFALGWLSNGLIVYNEENIRSYESDSYLCTMRGDGNDQRRVFHYSKYRGHTFSPDSYHSIAVSPDGSKIAMVSWGNHQLYIVRQGSPPALVETEGLKPHRVVWASDSSMLAYAAAHSEALVFEHLHVTRDDGTNRKRLGRVLVESDFAWSPNSQYIATIGVRKHIPTIDVISTPTAETRTIATVETDPESGGAPNCPEWSPDGQCMLYTTFAVPYMHIYRFDIATGQTGLVVGDEGSFRTISRPSWHWPRTD